MPWRIYLVLLLTVLTSMESCTDDEKREAGDSDTNTTIAADPLLEELKEKRVVYSDWQQFNDERSPGFSIDSFARLEEINYELHTRPAELHPQFYKSYGSLLSYNHDSTLFADAFSYSVIIEEKDGKLRARGGEADQEVAVINPATKERKRIFFCGPPCIVVKCVWLDEQNIALFGLSSDDGTEGYKPIIWVVDINNGHTSVYGYNGQAKNADPQAMLRYVMARSGIEMEY